jgi:hypothetical protein
MARQAAKFGDQDIANEFLLQSVQAGYFSTLALTRDPWLDSVRTTAAYQGTFAIAAAKDEHARKAFLEAGGDRIL